MVVERKVAANGPLDMPPEADAMRRGKKRVALNLKSVDDLRSAVALASKADVLVEGFRPGVMERLDLGPTELLAAQPGLVYCRISGFGQQGRDSQRPAHDLNFLAESGALFHMGRAEDVPLPPMNLVADFGAAGSLATVGILAAVLHARRTGQGQVLDLSMLQACRLLLTSVSTWRAHGLFSTRAAKHLDGCCPGTRLPGGRRRHARRRQRRGALLCVTTSRARSGRVRRCADESKSMAAAGSPHRRALQLAAARRLARGVRRHGSLCQPGGPDARRCSGRMVRKRRRAPALVAVPLRSDAVDRTPAIRAREDVETLGRGLALSWRNSAPVSRRRCDGTCR